MVEFRKCKSTNGSERNIGVVKHLHPWMPGPWHGRAKMVFPCLAVGINLADPDTARPGIRAADEDGVMNPLREAGITEADVRSLSRGLGLRTWNRENFSCLATRFPFGVSFGKERVRVHPPGIAVIEAVNPGRNIYSLFRFLSKSQPADPAGCFLAAAIRVVQVSLQFRQFPREIPLVGVFQPAGDRRIRVQ